VSSWTYFDGRGATVRTFGALTSQGHVGVTDIDYDEMGRVKRTSNPYYASGATAPINPSGKWTTVTYDKLGRAIEIELPDLTKIQSSYNGTTTTVTDQAGRQRRQLVDALGRVVRVDEPDASGNLGDVNSPVQPTLYEYNALGNITKVTQTQGSTTQERLFKYDSLSRLTHERQPEMNATLNDAGVKVGSGGLWTNVYVYDTNGLRTDAYDARGVQTHFTYDGLKRVKTVTFTGETNYQTANVTYTYDEERTGYFNKGGLTKVETVATSYAPSTTQVYDYDKMNRLSKQQQTIGANGSIAAQTYTIEYGYNLAGQLISQKYPSGRAVNFTVDEAGRVSTVFGGGRTYASGFNYAGHGGLLSVNYGNGVTESFSYNDRRQLTQQSLVKNNSVIQQYDYAYGVVDQSNGNVDSTKNTGQIARIEGYIGGTPSLPDKQWQQRFSYDTVGRLTQSSEYRNDSGTLSLTYKSQFDYDRWGNRYRKVANNPNSLPFIAIEDVDVDKVTNRFSSSTNTTYDEVGNATVDNKFRNLSFRYDANGRMVWSQNSSGQGSENKTVYNAMGNRVASLVNGQWQYFVYDIGGNLLAEYGQQQITTEKIRYYMQDHQASTRVVMNSTALVISRTDYQAFGEEIGANIGRRTTSQGYGITDNNRQRYAMTERDEATGLEHTWFRKYDNKAGRWTSPDPYRRSMSRGNPQSFNRYSYVQNDPVNNADPSGLTTCNVTFWFLVSASNTIYVGSTVNYCWGANPDTNGGGSHGTGGQQGQQGQEQPCDAKRTGDNTVDEIAQYFFGESTAGNTETYAWMKATISNRVAAGIKEFGCSTSEILKNLSTADDPYDSKTKEYGNTPFKQAASDEELAKLNEEQCANFKKAQQAARETASALPAFGSRSYTTPTGIGWPPLFWRAGNSSGTGYIGVGDTTFYSHDPDNGRGWSNFYDYKIRKAHSDTPEWRCS
jgi:RHS repeat-associated protein